MLEAYRRAMAKHIHPDTPIIIDLTDLAKPRAKKMKYLAYVRDGSEHKLVPGYRLLDGLQEFARLYQLRLGKTPLEPFMHSIAKPKNG